jgi:hypothetical protein
MREPHACQAKNSERMLFFEPIYSSLFLKFAIPVLKTLSLSLPTAPKRAKSVEVGLARNSTTIGTRAGHGERLSVRGLFSCPIPQRQLHVVDRDGARRYRRLTPSKSVVTRPPPVFHPFGHRPTGNVISSLLSWERHGRVQSRTPILGPDRALLALGPSANRRSAKPAKYVLLLCGKSKGNSILTRNVRSLVSPSSRAGRVSCRPPSLQRGRGTGDQEEKSKCQP